MHFACRSCSCAKFDFHILYLFHFARKQSPGSSDCKALIEFQYLFTVKVIGALIFHGLLYVLYGDLSQILIFVDVTKLKSLNVITAISYRVSVQY